MTLQRIAACLIFVALATGLSIRPQPVQADGMLAPPAQVSAYELILAMNTLRVSYGLPPLVEDPIINAVAQATAQTMAANNMSWHIGDVRGRIAAAGYGGGGTVWATENFAVSWNGGMGIDEILAVWADPDHMLPAVTPAYCNIGAGVATVNGKTYYILQAAYVSGKECGSYTSVAGAGVSTGSGLIVPVQIATPDAEGKIFHVVQAGQSFWSIAVAYQLPFKTSKRGITSRATRLCNRGNACSSRTKTRRDSPWKLRARDGGDTNSRRGRENRPCGSAVSIAVHHRGGVSRVSGSHLAVERSFKRTGLQSQTKTCYLARQRDTPAHVERDQKLTPDTSGNYYHVVQSGETLSGIANLYDVPLADLMVWNFGLGTASIIIPNQKLLLRITPPATATFPQRQRTITLTPSPSVASSPPTETATAEVLRS
ncbi:MAG: LysM peptidoglycan-binding domain-containing protein [Anaerolineales bacterium]